MRREPVDNGLMQYSLAKLNRRRSAKFVAMSGKIETRKYAQLILPTENQRFASGNPPEALDTGYLNTLFVVRPVSSARSQVPNIDAYLKAPVVSINLISRWMISWMRKVEKAPSAFADRPFHNIEQLSFGELRHVMKLQGNAKSFRRKSRHRLRFRFCRRLLLVRCPLAPDTAIVNQGNLVLAHRDGAGRINRVSRGLVSPA